MALRDYQVWFLTGSQHLYGPEAIAQVGEHSREIAAFLDRAAAIPVEVVYKPVLTTAEEIYAVCSAADNDAACAGVIAWMHTFSPAKNWIAGLTALRKPLLHLHTQYNRDIPWSEIDMDFMNLNQAAHGDREFGHMMSRLRMRRKVVVGHWRDEAVPGEIGVWARAAAAWQETRSMKVARIGDNMRSVAVTEGDKVAAQTQFGYQVNGYGVGDLAAVVNQVSDGEIDALARAYEAAYRMSDNLRKGGDRHESIREAARIELGLAQFLEDGGFTAFTTTFEDLHGLAQLPGLAVQRLMGAGYGFGAEGDWKTAALLRSLKVMAEGLDGGTSFMEDYTYHLHPDNMAVLGAHMLEVCPTIAAGQPSLEVHPLGIGGKADPARLVFNTAAGAALNASLIDLGDRFRMIVNTVDVIEPEAALPKLPVARALWAPHPNLKVGASAWIYAGGAHHTVFSQALGTGHIYDFSEMAGVEYVQIDKATDLRALKNELRWNDVAYKLASS
ncbi:MAG: L-arabinose isomerase [Chloroflexota bacterium]|nr:L-arabinose isomerase [Chloroflexota bacterium]